VSNIPDPNIIAIGATYKPDVCDLRESPALKIVALLREDGYRVRHYDPLVPEMGFDSIMEICRGADCLVILVEHDVVIKELANQYDAIRQVIRHPLILRFYADPL
jgi:UDP-N-acetyl-D-mannosaminuronic acid dehydrogenase